LFGMSLLEQSPCFATNKRFVMMNSQGHHILRWPNLQDLRRLKFTKQLVQTRDYNQIKCTSIHKQPWMANVSAICSP
jgi:hypothetical protein